MEDQTVTPVEGAPSIPFEDRSRPFFERLVATVGLAFSSPRRLFASVPEQDLGPPVVYALVVQTASMLVALLWQASFVGLGTLAKGVDLGEFAVSTGMLALMAALSPALALAALFIGAGIYHLMLLLLGGGRRGFAVTLRAQAYGGTPNLLAIVPLCGGLVGGIWTIVVTILGAYHGHRTDGWRAVLAYFLPAAACCCVVIWFFSSLGLLGLLPE